MILRKDREVLYLAVPQPTNQPIFRAVLSKRVSPFFIPERVSMIDPTSSEQIVTLLRRAADHIAQGIKNPEIHSDLHLLADIAESQD